MSYGAKTTDLFRHAGNLSIRFSRALSPLSCQWMQPTTFELIINLKAAKALGITVPPSLLARANEVIE